MRLVTAILFLFLLNSTFGQSSHLEAVKQRDVWVQDQTTAPFHRFLMREDKTDITLVSDVAKNDLDLVVSSGHGFVVGNWCLLVYGAYTQQNEVIAVDVDTITISAPLGIPVKITGTQIIRGKVDMAVNAGSFDSVYVCNVYGSSPIDVIHLHVFITDNLEGDDSKFGGISELTNGVLVRKCDHVDLNLGTYKKNGDFIQYGGSANYTSKAGGGEYSMDFAYNLKEIYGVVFRLDPMLNEKIIVTIQDNLSALSTFRIVASGQTTLGE